MNVYEELERYFERTTTTPVSRQDLLLKLELAAKYGALGFNAKVSRIEKEIQTIKPTPSDIFLWIALKLKLLRITPLRNGDNYHPRGFYGVMLERSGIKRRALILIPVNDWVGDVPNEILDAALLTQHNFSSLYVAPIVSGETKHRPGLPADFETEDLANIVVANAGISIIDPLLLGCFREELNEGLENFAVLGVWGDDWFDLKLP